MLNRQNKENRRKENNKGFSLVELIVVIAIMAVLVAVLAPQFTKYIDQSRKSNDAATVSGIVTAAQVGITDLTYSIPEATYTIKVGSTGTTVKADNNTGVTLDTTTLGTAETQMTKAIEDACGKLNTLKVSSKNWKDANDSNKDQISIKIVYSSGAVTVEYFDDFKSYIQ